MNTTPDQPDIVLVNGPLGSEAVQGSVVYSITLSNGYVVTRPSGFGIPNASAPVANPRPLPTC